jgi:hypothetical protein
VGREDDSVRRLTSELLGQLVPPSSRVPEPTNPD